MAESTPNLAVLQAQVVSRLAEVVKEGFVNVYGHIRELKKANSVNQEALATLIGEVEALREGKASKVDLARLLGDLNHLRNRLDTLEDDLPRALESLGTIDDLEGRK